MYSYNNFVAVAFTVFALVMLMLGVALRGALRNAPRDLAFRTAVLVFASSPGLVFFIHAVGYNDYFGILWMLGVVLLGAATNRTYSIFYWAVGSSAIAALIHEGLAVMFGPVLVFAMACHVLRHTSRRRTTLGVWLLLLVHLCGATLFLLSLSSLVSLIGVEDLKKVQALQQYAVAHADYTIHPKAFDALQRSSRENLWRLMPWYWSVSGHWIGAIQSWQSFAPGFLWMLVYGVHSALGVSLPEPKARFILALLFVVASLAPLSFNFVGWDWARWNGLALLASFSAILAMKLYFPTRHTKPPRDALLLTGLIVTVVGVASTTPLFDGFEVQFFPFQAHQDLLRQLVTDGFQYRPRF